MANNSARYPRDITMGPSWALDASGLASDTVDLPPYVRSLYLSAAGNVRVTLLDMPDGEYVTYPAVPVGRFVCQAKRLWSTGTTATVDLIEG